MKVRRFYLRNFVNLIEMKLSDIKTRDQLDEVADNWYNRTKRLSYAWQNSTDYDYIAKAFVLYLAMYMRIRMLTHVYMIISQPKNSHLKNGCIVAKFNKK